MRRVIWVLESAVFPESHPPLRACIAKASHRIVDWQDDWWANDAWPKLDDFPVVFHGSLGNAARIAARLPWSPGAWCDVPRFCCSAWYQHARPWLLHHGWRVLPADEFVAHARFIAAELGCTDRVFVRPDSPLKPFSGRVLDIDVVTLAALDYGYYYEDASIPIVIAPVREIGREWRFIIVKKDVIAGSEYDPASRTSRADSPSSNAWCFAADVASRMPAPEIAYVLDVCTCRNEFHLVELNPFSGADPYACSAEAIVDSISDAAAEIWETSK